MSKKRCCEIPKWLSMFFPSKTTGVIMLRVGRGSDHCSLPLPCPYPPATMQTWGILRLRRSSALLLLSPCHIYLNLFPYWLWLCVSKHSLPLSFRIQVQCPLGPVHSLCHTPPPTPPPPPAYLRFIEKTSRAERPGFSEKVLDASKTGKKVKFLSPSSRSSPVFPTPMYTLQYVLFDQG